MTPQKDLRMAVHRHNPHRLMEIRDAATSDSGPRALAVERQERAMDIEGWIRDRLDRRMKRIDAMRELAAATGRSRPEVENACRGESAKTIWKAVGAAPKRHPNPSTWPDPPAEGQCPAHDAWGDWTCVLMSHTSSRHLDPSGAWWDKATGLIDVR